MGRMMGLAIFASIGFAPISLAVAGAVIAWNYAALFLASGILISIISLKLATMPSVRKMGFEMGEL
jgi:hypothetical protein